MLLIVVAVPPSVAAQGFGGVHINFDTPNGYLTGFRDYLNDLSGIVSWPLSDGFSGSMIIIDPTSGEVRTLTDFGDLHQFNIAFDQVTLGQSFNSGAVDVINVVWFGGDERDETIDHSLASWQSAEALRIRDWQSTGNDGGLQPADVTTAKDAPVRSPALSQQLTIKKKNGIGLIYGMRMFERQDYQGFYASGGILGRTTSETWANNHVMGPAAGLVWINSRGRWTARLQGLASIGFNSGSVEQRNTVGAELVPGATNRLLYAQPTESAHHDSFDEFSPSGELRAELNYSITENVTFAINWSGVSVENALKAADRTRYYLPDMGLLDPGNQRILVHNFFCGIEMVR